MYEEMKFAVARCSFPCLPLQHDESNSSLILLMIGDPGDLQTPDRRGYVGADAAMSVLLLSSRFQYSSVKTSEGWQTEKESGQAACVGGEAGAR